MKAKSLLLHAILLLLILLALAPTARGQFAFTTNNGAITITSYNGSGGVVVIPGTTNGFPVTSIGNSAFQLKSSVTGVAIPNSITNIGLEAFLGCSSLTNVTIPNNVTNLGNQAFYNCAKLASATVGNGVTNLGYGTFYGCAALTGVTIGTNVESIGESAFYKCVSLTNITIPNGVSTIGTEAFFDCSSLTNITIPGSVTNIASDAFAGCTNLGVMAVATLNPSYSAVSGVLFDRGQTTLVEYPGQAGNYTIPDSVTNIGDQAFYDCANLTNLTMSTNITSIGSAAFSGCSGLTDIAIPGNVTSIGQDAFSGCSNLTAITVDPANLFYSSFNGVLFDKTQTILVACPGGLAGSYVIPNTVIAIGTDAFTGCASLSSVVIPDGVTCIGTNAFTFCNGLTRVTIPNSVTNIEYEAFYGCSSLTNLTIGSGVTSIGDAAFVACNSLTEIYFLGDAPGGASDIWPASSPTIYYLPGTTGWGTNFDWIPTVQWNPQVKNDASFGILNNRFGFNITGSSNLVIVVEACTNLANPVWVPVQTNILSGGSAYFSDSQWTNFPGRFYRFRSP